MEHRFEPLQRFDLPLGQVPGQVLGQVVASHRPSKQGVYQLQGS